MRVDFGARLNGEFDRPPVIEREGVVSRAAW